MQTIKISASKSYEVSIGSGLLSADGVFRLKDLSGKTAVIVSDDTVFDIYGQKLLSLLSKEGIKTMSFVFPRGEQSKNLNTYGRLVEKMCEEHITRSDVILALGGGVVGDMAGFAAATYQRGIDFIQLPTTLLAAVDSSVGGKTGVDLAAGKNQIGAFYQPAQVICDIDTLCTLPKDEYLNGCAEIIKYAVLGNEDLFESIKQTPVCDQYESVIATCVSMKRDIVQKDEFDLGLRMLLNFGHTVGHGVEACSGYSVPHGKGVAIGMAVITKAAAALGYCDKSVYEELLALLKQYGLPYETEFAAEDLKEAMLSDKKSKGDNITLIIPKRIGECVPLTIKRSELITWLNAGGVK